MSFGENEPLTPQAVADAHERIQAYVHHTPLLESKQLNHWLGHRVVFKAEGLQKVGAFKMRGAINTLLQLKEQGALPKRVVAFSSGNHAQALAHSAQIMGVESTIFMPKSAALVKRQATLHYGAEVVVTETRQQAEEGIQAYIADGSTLIHPYDNNDIIAGQGTACLEALLDGVKPDVIFATCGGGGWLSGTYLAAQLLAPKALIFGAEPRQANDAAQSLRKGSIVKLSESPDTIADGAQTLAVAERTFYFLRKLAGMVEVGEDEIVYWTQWLSHLLKTAVEPTAAVAMAGLAHWLREQQKPQTALVMLSGGNVSAAAQQKVWAQDYLQDLPDLNRAWRVSA